MRLVKALLAAAAILAALAGPAEAARQLQFLSPADVAPDHLLPPPPADASDATRAELKELRAIAASASADAFARASADDLDEEAGAIGKVLGPGFNLRALPATDRMLADVINEEKVASGLAKKYFQRNRPWVLDPKLKTCQREDAPRSSYPSGHATMGYAVALALGAAAPEQAQALLARARDYAENRLVCAVHYRSDVIAGQALATAVAEDLLHNPAFRAELNAARTELVAARLAQP